MSDLTPFIFVKDQNGSFARVLLKDVLFVKSLGNYLQIQTTAQQITTYGSLSGLEDFLKADSRFVRAHRSFLVNLDHVQHFSAEGLDVGGYQVPISSKSYDQLKSTYIANFLFKSTSSDAQT